jgi:hypothetical protein
VTDLKEYFALPPNIRVQPGKEVLGHVHSGDLLTHSLPKLLRIGTVSWFIAYTLTWLAVWSDIYKNYERWGLMQVFFAQMISIFAAFLVVSITFVRTKHMAALPGDDFIFLRMLAVFCRWSAEVALVLAVGASLSALLSSVSLPLLFLSPSGGAPNSILGFGLKLFALLAVFASFLIFLFLYAVATGVDLMLAIEFNTRADRIARASRLVESGQP